MRFSPIVAIVLCTVLAQLATSARTRLSAPIDARKHLAGPASEFSLHLIPDSKLHATDSSSSLIPFTLSPSGVSTLSWTSTFVVDSSKVFVASLFTPIAGLQVKFRAPSADALNLVTDMLGAEDIVEETSFGFNANVLPSTSFRFVNPEQGTWTVEVSRAGTKKRSLSPAGVSGYFLMHNEEAHTTVATYLRSYDLHVGASVAIDALVAELPNAAATGKGILRDVVTSAQVDLELPSGQHEDLQMHDDGVGLDVQANDGVYVASATLSAPGLYTARVEMQGTMADGTAFERTAQVMFSAVAQDVILSGSAQVVLPAGQQDAQFTVDVTWADNAAIDQTYFVYSEVWGSDAAGQLVPVAWMGGMTDIELTTTGQHVFNLLLDKDWLRKAGASAPFELRNVFVQDRYTHVPLSRQARIAVTTGVEFHMPRTLSAQLDLEVTERMLMGDRPLWMRNSTASNGDGTLLLVHGYCTASPGPFTRSDFSNAVAFEDWRANRPVDEFALMVKELGDKYPAFSIVAHSQGGLVGTHLNAMYWSNLQQTTSGGRRVQSVGSPYQGTALASNLAAIGSVFGVGCGMNSDMTRDGAALWLAGIPASIRAQTNYFTSHYAKSGLLHYCHMAANAVLSWPNDGTTEHDYNQFPGAVNQGNVEGWCHSDAMHHPPQCTDSARNVAMNAAAAR
eukprot:TRINITY_DN4886_c0_g1_i1.p1 TRINITY_DN4886_c0_g1~~TRINITY_DN4886_c0_g1_i1.p1  ORF type:complete len:678 (-),score=155.19 TRINITY_DN4886_c0_g1_i1:126-2159(-)